MGQQILTGKFKIDRPTNYRTSATKNKYSCMPCRTSKRKCSRDITGCYNCMKYRKECIYSKEVLQINSKNKSNNKKPDSNTINENKSVPEIGPTDAPEVSTQKPIFESEIPIETIPDTRIKSQSQKAQSADDIIWEQNESEFIKHLAPSPLNNESGSNFFLNILGFFDLKWMKPEEIIKPSISKNLAWTFIEAYFKHSHRSYPFICESTFLQTFNQFENLNDSISTYFEFEIYMIMNIGCTTLTRAKLLDKGEVFSRYFSYKCIGFLLKGVPVNDLDTIKILLFLCIYSYFEPQGIHTWNLFGLLIRAASTLGLNQNDKSNDSNTVELEMRNRLFWSIYNMDRLLSISLGRPVSIDEMDIDVDLPKSVLEEDEFTFNTILAIIKLRQIEGTIIKKCYSIKAKKYYKEASIQDIKNDLEEWILINKPNDNESFKIISFHGADNWFYSRYYHNLMLLYRPNYLISKPDARSLKYLSQYCVASLSCTHRLFESNLLPLNWITLYRFLNVCSTMLYCLCNLAIDLNKSKVEIDLLIEILNAFSQNWIVASKCSQVFQNIVDNIFLIFLTSDGQEVSNINELSNDLLGASSAYHEILNNNSIEMSFTSMFLDELLPNNF